jgi:hypothetical protein
MGFLSKLIGSEKGASLNADSIFNSHGGAPTPEHPGNFKIHRTLPGVAKLSYATAQQAEAARLNEIELKEKLAHAKVVYESFSKITGHDAELNALYYKYLEAERAAEHKNIQSKAEFAKKLQSQRAELAQLHAGYQDSEIKAVNKIQELTTQYKARFE